MRISRTMQMTVLVAGVAIIAPLLAHAVALLPPCAAAAGRCGLNDIVQTLVNFAKILLGFVGSAVLAFFVYGGFVWLTSGGNSTKIEHGKSIVTNSVIGLIIVFGAFTLIQFIFGALGVRENIGAGLPCSDSGGSGIYVADPHDATQLHCVKSCTESPLNTLGYSCMNPSEGANCISGLCPGGTDSVCCQHKTPSTP